MHTYGYVGNGATQQAVYFSSITKLYHRLVYVVYKDIYVYGDGSNV